MLKIILLPIFSILVTQLLSCSTIVKGRRQSINVESSPAGASCTMKRGGAILTRRKTPFIANISRASGDIITECNKRGHGRGINSTASSVSGWVFGNILLGGLLGLIIDGLTGSMYEYPYNIYLNLGEKENIQKKKKKIPRDWSVDNDFYRNHQREK